MWTFVLVIAVIYLIIQAFLYHIVLGIGAVLGVLAYGYFRWYSDFCTARARAVYSKDAGKAMEWFERGYKRGMTIGQQEVYAYYLLREGQTERAEDIYNYLLTQRLRPELRLKLRAEYSVLLLKTGRIDEAVENLEEITMNYRNTTTYGTLGYLYLLKNNRRKAEEYNLEAYEYNSSDPVILDNCTQLYIKKGDFDAAKKYADEMVEKKPYFAEAYYDSAFVYVKLGDFEKAQELIESAKKCKITFMSNVSEKNLDELEFCIQNQNADISHMLGDFTKEEQSDTEELLEYIDDEEPEIEYETIPDSEIDEDDPFI